MELSLLHSRLNTPNPSLAIPFVLLLTTLTSPDLGTRGSQINPPPLAFERLGVGQGISWRDTCGIGWGFFYFEPLASAFCFMTPDNRQNWFCTCRSTGKPLHWLEHAFDEGLPTGSFRLSSAWISHSIPGTWLILASVLSWFSATGKTLWMTILNFPQNFKQKISYIHFVFTQQLSDQRYFITFGCINSYVNKSCLRFSHILTYPM